MQHIEAAVIAHPELAERYGKLGQLYDRKLWHQLTGALSEFVHDDGNRRGDSFIQLYNEFISKFEGKLNQLELAKLVGVIVRSFANTEAALKFVEALSEKSARLGPAAALFLSLLRLSLLLHAPAAAPAGGSSAMVDSSAAPAAADPRAAAMATVKAALAEKKNEVDALSGLMDTCVHSAYYELATEYYKQAGPPEQFYKHALMLLAYTPLDGMGADRAAALATDMSLAALAGDGVYNFGEVLATPIVAALAGTPNAWLGEMLRVFNRGDVEAFAQLYAREKAAFDAQPALCYRLDFVKEKLSLLALMNFVFETPADERTIPFSAVAAHCRVPVDQVEWMAMRAMSLGLIKGSMDEIDQTLQVDWVQPRVLDAAQMGHLAGRLGEWAAKVDDTGKFIEGQTLELGI